MDKSDRLTIIAVLILLLGVFYFLFLILGGGEALVVHDDIPVSVEIDDYEGIEDEDTYRSTFTLSGGNDSGVTGSSGGRISASSGGGFSFDDDSEKEVEREPSGRAKFHPKFMERARKGLNRTLEFRQKKLRKRLQEKGFRSDAYIEYKLLALDKSITKPTIKKVEALVERGDTDAALAELENALARIDRRNLRARGKILATIVQLGMGYGYASAIRKHIRSLVEVQDQVNTIKRGTILMNNPLARERLENEAAMIQKWKDNPESFEYGMDHMVKNKGFSESNWGAIRAAFVKMENSGGPLKGKAMRDNYKLMKEHTDKHWANPK